MKFVVTSKPDAIKEAGAYKLYGTVSSLVYTLHKQRGITRINFGRVWYDVSSRIFLAGLSVILQKSKVHFVLLSCVAWCVRWVGVGSGYLRYPE